MLRPIALLAAWIMLGAVQPNPWPTGVRVDPMTIEDDDFARHRDPQSWHGLAVSQIEFREERGRWRLFRIANRHKPRGPLWFVPHDNENAGFDAALAGVRAHGGVIIAVDSGVADDSDGIRRNVAVAFGRPIDPNRNFRDARPRYADTILADYHRGARPVIALHTNSPGFDPTDSHCNKDDPVGRGEVSIRFCSDVMHPQPSQGRAWPFDDDDTLAYVAHRHGASPLSAYCGKALMMADFNIVFERVKVSDGSLSNHALLHGLDYINFETQERGLEPARLRESRDRLTAMIDQAVRLCVKPASRLAR